MPTRSFPILSIPTLLKTLILTACVPAGAILSSAAASADPARCDLSEGRSGLDYALYFRSDVRDHPGCRLAVEDGRAVVYPAVSNPAMTCPDMTGWLLFAEAVKAEFWNGWAGDDDLWPEQPWPLCTDDGGDCCDPASVTEPAQRAHCPFYPGDTPEIEPLQGRLLSKAHAAVVQSITDTVVAASGGTVDTPDPGRVIRQEMTELVHRNRPMYDYIYRHGLYHADGLKAVFAAANGFIDDGAPYQPDNPAADGVLTAIDLPVAAVMIKSNWLPVAFAEQLGLEEDPDYPYIRMMIKPAAPDLQNKYPDQAIEHWLMSFHISSKDIPNWVWTTFEHVHNLGRCDFIGCNDSYGYRSADPHLPPRAATNFVRPHQQNDQLGAGASDNATCIFDIGERYPPETITPGLDKLFTDLGIGREPNPDSAASGPGVGDPAWRSYRMKGSQVEFVDKIGRPTLLGNSITEGGFMISSSCITCHGKASTGAAGKAVLSVFENEYDLTGYLQSTRGVPNPAWYHQSSSPSNKPGIRALQTDFIWGFLNARPLESSDASGPE